MTGSVEVADVLMPRRTALLTLAAIPLLSVKLSPARALPGRPGHQRRRIAYASTVGQGGVQLYLAGSFRSPLPWKLATCG